MGWKSQPWWWRALGGSLEALPRLSDVCSLSSCLAGLKDAGPGSPSEDAHQTAGILTPRQQTSAVPRPTWGQGERGEGPEQALGYPGVPQSTAPVPPLKHPGPS